MSIMEKSCANLTGEGEGEERERERDMGREEDSGHLL